MTPGTTITIKAKAGTGGSMAYTSFTLWKDSALNPPSISNLPNRAVQLKSDGTAEYKTLFVVGDLNNDGSEDLCKEDEEGNEDCSQSSLAFSATSSNTNLLPEGGITFDLMQPNDFEAHEGPRSFLLTATTSPTPAPGRATVTVNVTDKDGNITTTSFVLRTVANSNEEPKITNEPVTETFVEQFTSETSKSHSFTVIGAANLNDLKVTASSSNTNLVPNDLDNNLIITQPVNGVGSIEIVPVTPLPSPSPGVPQASTITLSVTDDAYLRQTTFLYVLAPGDGAPENGGVATSFSRPSGVYSLNAGPNHRIDDSFLTGEMHGKDITWAQLESAPINGIDDFHFDEVLGPVFENLPLGQDISLNLQQEPCYIADHEGVVTWCDTNLDNQPDPEEVCTSTLCNNGFKRAVPWDQYLQDRRDNFLQALSAYLNNNPPPPEGPPYYIDQISIINPNLPGAEAGIRNVSVPFDVTNMPGYSRAALLGAVQHELRSVQKYFPGKLVQIGFWQVTDDQDGSYGDSPLWKWLYRDATTDTDPGAVDEDGVHVVALFDEFNGVKRPRVSFFQENLAAARISVPIPTPTITPTPTPTPIPPPSSSAPNYITPPDTTAYTFTPMLSFLPSFAYYPAPPSEQDLKDRYNNGIVFQALTTFSNPSMEKHGLRLIHTINGSPNDAMEAAFNNLLSEYLEVYIPDLDEANPLNAQDDPTLNAELWAGELQSWHDYAFHLRNDLTPIEAPAGLTVERIASDNNIISWHAVYGATAYQLQTIDFTAFSPTWIDLAGCDPSLTQCTDTTTSTDSKYGYRVRARNSNATITTPWSYVAVFLSEGPNDGYVKKSGNNKNPFPSEPEPGIRAGRGTSNVELRGFLSFDTAALAGTTVVGAKLRMYQETDNSAFSALGPCQVDIKKGAFNDNVALEGMDFAAQANDSNVAQVRPPQIWPAWVEAELSPLKLGDVNNSTDNFGHTQFRLHFDGIVNNKQAKWDSGGTVDSDPSTPPQLIVQYKQ